MSFNPYINILSQLAIIDGEPDSAEYRLIRHLGASARVSDQDIDTIMENTKREHTVPSIEFLSTEKKMDLMLSLIIVMKMDGLTNEDLNLLLNVAKKLGFDEKGIFDLMTDDNFVSNMKMIRHKIEACAERQLIRSLSQN